LKQKGEKSVDEVMLAQFVGMPKKFEQPKEPEFQLRREGFKVDSKKM